MIWNYILSIKIAKKYLEKINKNYLLSLNILLDYSLSFLIFYLVIWYYN